MRRQGRERKEKKKKREGPQRRPVLFSFPLSRFTPAKKRGGKERKVGKGRRKGDTVERVLTLACDVVGGKGEKREKKRKGGTSIFARAGPRSPGNREGKERKKGGRPPSPD